jgi:transcriptional regulator with XRE-family HTH domain
VGPSNSTCPTDDFVAFSNIMMSPPGATDTLGVANAMESKLFVPSRRPDPVDKHVGRRLKVRRQELGITQSGLAKQLNLSFQQVQKYEKGTTRVSASRLQQLCQILDVQVPFFFEGGPQRRQKVRKAGEDSSATAIFKFVASPDGLALLKAFTSIDDKKIRRLLVRLVEAVGQPLDSK